MDIVQLFIKLLIGHSLADYPLQADFLSKAKNHKNPISGIPFYLPLASHALIHMGFVWYITNNFYLGIAEFALHSIIDYLKCNGNVDFTTDQTLHVSCKAVYLLSV